MSKGRMEAFSDGVIAIIITIMILEMKAPHGATPSDLLAVLPAFLSYILSFVFLGIYWNNHHHLLQTVRHVNGKVLWSNLHLLFWLSLVPFVTAWMGENHFSAWPVATYGFVLLCCGLAYLILSFVLISLHGKDSPLAKAVSGGTKEKLSFYLYVAAVPLTFVHTAIALSIYIFVAVIWIIPDRRIEKILAE